MAEKLAVAQYRFRLMKEVHSYIKHGGTKEDAVEAMLKTLLELSDCPLSELERRYAGVQVRPR